MRLDLPTLFAITVVITYVVGVLFLMSWNQARGTRALLYWGVAHLCGGTASALICLRTIIPDALSIGLANAVMLAAYGLIWTGLRSFEGRPARPYAVVAGSALWIAACLVPWFYASLQARVVLASATAGLYCALGAAECWRGRTGRLPSRGPTIVLMAAYAVVYGIRIPFAFAMPVSESTRVMGSVWMPILCFAAIAFTVALAFVFMALTKERAEREQRIAAETDPLTGVANRRAFVRQAQTHLVDANAPVALLLFDLDHFKDINDRYGHGVGDAVLAGFSHLALGVLPKTATFGRLGGEEFGCVMPGIGTGEARRLADRVRTGLAEWSVAAYPELRVRTSVGIAIRRADGDIDFDALAREADAALYRAKSNGRDRIEIAALASGNRAAA